MSESSPILTAHSTPTQRWLVPPSTTDWQTVDIAGLDHLWQPVRESVHPTPSLTVNPSPPRETLVYMAFYFVGRTHLHREKGPNREQTERRKGPKQRKGTGGLQGLRCGEADPNPGLGGPSGQKFNADSQRQPHLKTGARRSWPRG